MTRESVLSFDGNADYITVADSQALRVTKYTVEAWVKSDGVPNTVWSGIVGKPGRNYNIWLNNTGYVEQDFHTTANTNTRFPTPAKSLEWNKWQHIAITNDGTTAKTYINGEVKADNPIGQPLVVDKTDLIMGACLDGATSWNAWFKGQLTEMRLWNKVRTEKEIKDDMFRRLKGNEDGLAGYWPLNDIANNTASDETENENHGKVSGAIEDEQLHLIDRKTKKSDTREYVLRFDGSDDYVKVENPPSPTKAITVSCWAKSKTPKWNASSMLVSKRSSFILCPNANSKTLVFYIYSGGVMHHTSSGLNNVDITKWHHYAGTFDGKIIRLYVDGQEVNNTLFSGTIDQDTNPMHIGSNSPTNNPFDGKIREVRVWDKALTAKEIQDGMLHPLTGSEANLVGYWRLDRGHGDIASDETSNRKHGTIVGAVWDEQLPIYEENTPQHPKVDLSSLTSANAFDYHKTDSVLYFDGDQDYISIVDEQALRVTKYTVEAWVKPDGVPNTAWSGIVGKPGRNYNIWLSNTGYVEQDFHTTTNTNTRFPTPAKSLQWNKWQHIAITNDGTTAKTYINGELKADSPVGHPLVVDKTNLIMGACLDGPTSWNAWFKGYLTEIRLWKEVRTETEIKDNMLHRLKGDEEGLAGYWPLNNVGNNIASDETDNENHGKVYGAVDDQQFPLITGQSINDRQYVLKFDGSGDYVKVENPPSPTKAITVSCWAKSKTPKWNATSMLVSRRPSYILCPNANSKTLVFYIYSGGVMHNTSSGLNNVDITKWHHYAGTFDGKIIRLYVDGQEVNNTLFSGTIDQDTNSMYIGSNSPTNNPFEGKMTEVQVWDKALTPAEIQKTMTHKLSGYEENLVGYWPLDKGHGDIATDETLNDEHGVIVGAVWDEQLPIGIKPAFVEVDLSKWKPEHYDDPPSAKTYNKPNPAKWDVAADGKSVRETQDALPSYFFSDFTTKGHSILAKLTVTTSPRNLIGFALNFHPKDANSSSADFLLLNWKARKDPKNTYLKLSRVKGKPRFIDYTKLDDAVPGEKAKTLSSTKWVDHKTYEFKFERKNNKLQIWIDGSLEFDLDDNFSDGHFACFVSGQRDVIFS
ncbi:MAG: LamG domain-containing protein, partial [Symploca sp. SIO2D2]|nr:LamG domain-containing protein [Symploca sp. SIO2D2]